MCTVGPVNRITAVCAVHGAFPSRMFAAFNVSGLTLSGNKESCPVCGRSSRIIDGTFNVSSEGLIEVLSAPNWTKDVLSSVRDALRAVQSIASNPDAVVSQLEETSPKAAQLVNAATRGWTRDQKIALMAVLIPTLTTIIIFLLGQKDGGQALSPDEVSVIVEQVLEQVQETRGAERPTGSTRRTGPLGDRP